jgi:hypothetical protein
MHVVLVGSAILVAIIATSFAFALRSPTSPNAVFAPCHSTAKLVCLTRNASGHTTTVHKGQVIELILSGTGLSWTKPQVIGQQLLRQVGAAPLRNGERREDFSAIATGHTMLQASATAKCAPGQVCPQFALLWRAAIVVIS